MKQLVNFEHFKIINEAEEKLEACLNSISESIINEGPAERKAQTKIGAALQSPIKFIKLKNNAKRYQQTLVQQALNDLDFEKKKQAAGGEVDADKKEVLAAANKAKNQALSDKEKAIADRMADLATSPGLQAVKTLAISKAKVAAAEITLKGADGEESKQLKIKIKELNAKASKAEKAIKDYTKEEPAKKVEPESTQREEPEQQELPPTAQAEETPNKEAIEKLNTKIEAAREKYKQASEGDDVKAKTDTELAVAQLKLEKGKLENDKDAIQSAQDSIERIKMRSGEAEATDNTETETTEPGEKEDNTEKIAALDSKIDGLKQDKKTKEDQLNSKNHPDVLAVEVSIKSAELEKAKLNGDADGISSANAALKTAQEDKKDAVEKEGGNDNETPQESAKYIGESVSDKFRQLMAERLK